MKELEKLGKKNAKPNNESSQAKYDTGQWMMHSLNRFEGDAKDINGDVKKSGLKCKGTKTA